MCTEGRVVHRGSCCAQRVETASLKKMSGEVSLAEFIEVKGWKALGNKLSDQKLTNVKEVDAGNKEKLSPGDSIEFDVDKKDKGQGELF